MRRALMLVLAATAGCAYPETVTPTGTGLAATPDAGSPPPVSTPTAPEPQLLAAYERGLDNLSDALLQQEQWQLWSDVLETASAARDAFSAASDDPLLATRAAAGVATADALADWHQLYLDSLDADPDDVVGALQGATFASHYEGLIGALRSAEGQIPQTSVLLAEVLFQGARDDEGSAVLSAALPRWPEHAALHESARAWRNAIPDPEPLVALLSPYTNGDGRTAAHALLTRAWLNASLGGTEYNDVDLEAAADRYDDAAHGFVAAAERAAIMSPDEADLLAAEHYALAGWSHYYTAENGEDPERVVAALARAEESFGNALTRVHAHEQSVLGINYVGDLMVNPARLDDMEAGRVFFRRMAERHDLAEWWNNYAFFSRETEHYEDSYAAYQKCIALAPDNARWVNDTALILVYHLNRDLDQAEELLLRAKALGQDVCKNPFIDDDVFDQNFEAYGDAMLNLSLLYMGQGRIDDAASEIDALLDVAPGRLDALAMKQQIEAARPRATEEPEAPGGSSASNG